MSKWATIDIKSQWPAMGFNTMEKEKEKGEKNITASGLHELLWGALGNDITSNQLNCCL